MTPEFLLTICKLSFRLLLLRCANLAYRKTAMLVPANILERSPAAFAGKKLPM